MSDSEMWKAHDEQVKAHRAKMLAQADTTGWTKHTDYHFSRVFNGNVRVNWWPSGGKCQIGKRMVYGHANVRRAIDKLKAAEPRSA